MLATGISVSSYASHWNICGSNTVYIEFDAETNGIGMAIWYFPWAPFGFT